MFTRFLLCVLLCTAFYDVKAQSGCDPVCGELVPNGNFELGCCNWGTAYSPGSCANIINYGNSFLGFIVDNDYGTGTPPCISLSSINLIPGQEYCLSYDFNSSSNDDTFDLVDGVIISLVNVDAIPIPPPGQTILQFVDQIVLDNFSLPSNLPAAYSNNYPEPIYNRGEVCFIAPMDNSYNRLLIYGIDSDVGTEGFLSLDNITIRPKINAPCDKYSANFSAIGLAGLTDLAICKEQILSFTMDEPTPPDPLINFTYTWTISQGGNVLDILVTDVAETVYSYEFNTSGSYEVQLLVENCVGCTLLHTVTVTVSEDEACEITCPSVICEGDIEEYTALCNCPEYQWKFLVDGIEIGSDTGNPAQVEWTGLPANYSGYGLIVLNTPNCPEHSCQTTYVDIAIISENLEISGPELICSGSNDLIYSVPMWPGSNYTWSVEPTDGQGAIDWDEGYNSVTVNLSPEFNRTFTVSVVVNHNFLDCETSASLDVISNATTIAGQEAYCAGDQIELSLSGARDDLVYQVDIYNNNDLLLPVTSCTGSGLGFSCIPPSLTVGEYTATISIFINGQFVSCTFSDFHFKINENTPISDGDIIGERIICAGNPYTYSIAGNTAGTTINWVFEGADILDATGTEVTLVWLPDAVVYSMMVTKSIEGCTDQTITIIIVPRESPLLEIAGEQDVCVDSEHPYTLQLNDVPFGEADLINWTTLNGSGSVISGQGTNTIEIQWHQLGNEPEVTETVVAEIEYCGFTLLYTLEVVVNASPDIEIIAPTSACQDESVHFLSSLVVPGASYEWTLGNTGLGNTQNIAYTFTSPGNYNVQLVVGNLPNCPGNFVAFHNINILPNPEPVITSTGFIEVPTCLENGYSTTINLFTGNNPNYTYQWQRFIGQAWTDISGANNAQYAVAIDNSAFDPGYGLYRVQVTQGSCTNESNFIDIDCPNLPPPCKLRVTPTIAWSFGTGCGEINVAGSVDVFDLTSYEYSWVMLPFGGNVTLESVGSSTNYSNGFEYPITASDQFDINLTFADPGFFTLRLKVKELNGNCSIWEIANLEVPIIADYRYEVLDCSPNGDGSVNFSFIDLSEAISIDPPGTDPVSWSPYWTISAPGQPIQEGGGSPFTANFVPGETYTITMLANTSYTNNGAISPSYFCAAEVIELTLPDATAEFNITSSNYCISSAITFEPVMDDNFVESYHWDFGGVFSGLRSPSYTYSTSGLKTVTLTITTSYGCEISQSLTIEIYPAPEGNILPEILCGAVSLCYFPTAGNPIVAYEWSNGDITECSPLASAGSYWLTVTDDLECSAVFNYILSDFPSIEFAIQGPTTLCVPEGGALFTYSTSFSPNATYNWSITPPLNNQPGEPHEFTAIFTQGTYTLSLTVTQDGQTCSSESIIISVNAVPVLDITTTSYCDPYRTLVKETGGLLLEWSFNGNVINPSANSIITSIPGVYAVSYTENNCTTNQSVYVPEGDIDFSTLLSGCYEVCPKELTESDCVPGLQGTYIAWEWQYINGGNPTSFDPPLAGTNSEVSDLCLTAEMFTGTNLLEIVLVVTSEAGCVQTSKSVSFKPTACESDCFTVTTGNVLCYNVGSKDPSDDHWTFEMTVTGGLPGSYWHTEGLNGSGGEENGSYNETKTIWMGNIGNLGGTTITFLVFDYFNPECFTTVSVVVPNTCSVSCDLATTVISTDCSKKPAGMYFVTVTITGTNEQCWMAKQKLESGDEILIGQGVGDPPGPVTFGPFSPSQGNWVLWMMICGQYDCSLDIYIKAPNCSEKRAESGGSDLSGSNSKSNPGIALIAPQVNIQPNPANTFIEVRTPDAMNLTIEIYTLHGQKLIAEKVYETSSKLIDVNHLAQGMYVVKIKDPITGENLRTEKLVIVK